MRNSSSPSWTQDGKAINNCPPVTLTIASGPGEFPTGPSITFDPNSDITIRDGQAAIEFRSYYAGKTVIRATSPGLKDATAEIVSLGGPEFIAGKTAPVKPRPLCAFHRSACESFSHQFWLEHPVRVSSEAPGHGGAWPTTETRRHSGRPPKAIRTPGGRWTWSASWPSAISS